MAAAEARAAWQRTSNRCFFQEDARRAPKFASSSPLQNDSTHSTTTNGQEEPNSNFIPLNWNPMNSNLPPDTKWWLQLQSNFGHQQNFTYEQLSVIGHELKEKINETTDFENSDFETIVDEIKLINKKYESDWVGNGKCEPWWRVADQEELASLVAQKSVEHIENCDLPRPSQTVHCSRNPFGCVDVLDGNRRFMSATSSKLPSFASVSTDDNGLSSEHSYLPSSNDEKLFRSDSDSSRAELLEALCHSQTRAREAEIAAEKAYNEKEHIIKLFFKQASHLFAYKQWLYMLQLENLYLQFKLKEQQISTIFPTLPWMPLNRKESKNRGKKHKRRRGFCKYMMAFAVGLGLTGAGLLLGWTLGWLFPYF